MPTKNFPLVSVIIPMFNAASFIEQTLESLHYQTMKNFEIVLIDDCSTDNSVEIAENLAERFGGRLHVIKLTENNGAPAVPRNIGINIAHGKYLAFLDNDDFFTATALEELTTLAEEYQADVINMSEFLEFKNQSSTPITVKEALSTSLNHETCRNSGTEPLQAATVISDNIAERMKLWLNNEIHWATWATFCRKDFWVTNQITFPQMPVSDDMIANFACLCFAEKYLRVPNVIYIRQKRKDSISQERTNVGQFIHKWLSNLTLGFKALEDIMNRVPFFKKHIDYRYALLNWFFNRGFWDAQHFPKVYSQVHTAVINQFVEKEFHGEDAAFSAYLFNLAIIYRM